MKCLIRKCLNNTRNKMPGISFHRLPKPKEEKQKWLKIIGVDQRKYLSPGAVVCSIHFEEQSLWQGKSRQKLKISAFPAKFLDNPNMEIDTMDYPLSSSSTDCAVLNCNSKRKNGAHLFNCSNVYDNYKLWLQNCHLIPSTGKPNLICSKHFEPQCFLNGKLKRSAVPTLFLPNQAKVLTSSEIYYLQNGVVAENIDQINSNQETLFSEFECDEEIIIPTDIIKEEPDNSLDVVKKEPSISFSDENSCLGDTEVYSSIDDESTNSAIYDESPMQKDFQFCNTNSSTTCNCSNRLTQLENNQREIKLKLDQLLELVRDITTRN